MLLKKVQIKRVHLNGVQTKGQKDEEKNYWFVPKEKGKLKKETKQL